MYLLGLYKRENLFLPFVFISFLNIIIGQFGFESIIRPIEFSSINKSPKDSHIKLYSTFDIGVVSENDSIKIYNEYQGINTKYKFNSFFIDVTSMKENTQFKYSENLYFLNYYKSLTKVNTEIELNNFSLIKPSFFFQLDNKGNKSHGFSLSVNKKNINIISNYRLINESYYLNLMYDDFDFEQKITNTEKQLNLFFSYNFNNFNLVIQTSKHENKMSGFISSFENQNLKFNENIQNKSSFEFVFKVKSNQFFKTHYSINSIDLSFDIFSDYIDVIKINKYKFDSDFISFDYSINKNQNIYSFGFFRKEVELLASLRLRTSLISDSFEAALEAPIINNYDTGSVISNGIFFNVKKILKHNSEIQFNGVFFKEYYDVKINNYLLSMIGIPIGTDIRKLDYNYKDALILGLEINHDFNKLSLIVSLNQHIPINIDKDRVDAAGGDSSAENVKKNRKYGGGVINFLLSIPF